MENTKKSTIISLCIVAGFLIIGLGLSFLLRKELTTVHEQGISLSNTEEGDIRFEIETFRCEDGFVEISGWRVLPTNERRSFGTFALLIWGHRCYRLPTEYVPRPDVTDIIGDGNEYVRSGFYSRIPVSELPRRGTFHLYLICRPDTMPYQDYDYSDYYVIDTEKEIEVN